MKCELIVELFLQLLEQTFTWFNGQDPKVWRPVMKELPRYHLFPVCKKKNK